MYVSSTVGIQSLLTLVLSYPKQVQRAFENPIPNWHWNREIMHCKVFGQILFWYLQIHRSQGFLDFFGKCFALWGPHRISAPVASPENLKDLGVLFHLPINTSSPTKINSWGVRIESFCGANWSNDTTWKTIRKVNNMQRHVNHWISSLKGELAGWKGNTTS